MRKIVVSEFVSYDGVLQAPGVRTKIPRAASSTVAGRIRTGTMTSARTSFRP